MQQSAGNTTTVVTTKSPDSKASQTFWSQNLFIFLKNSEYGNILFSENIYIN